MDPNVSSRLLNQINLYLDNQLNPDEVDELWSEVLEHPECYHILKANAALKKKAQRGGASKNVPRSISSPLLEHKKVALAIAALLLLTAFLRLYITFSGQESLSVTNEIPIVELLSPEVTRSASQIIEDKDTKLINAKYLSVSGNTDDALKIYSDLLENGFKKDTINFNMGIIYYNQQQFIDAADSFENIDCYVFGDTFYTASCFWYSAISHFKIEDLDRTKFYSNKTIETGHVFKDEAKKMLDYLSNEH